MRSESDGLKSCPERLRMHPSLRPQGQRASKADCPLLGHSKERTLVFPRVANPQVKKMIGVSDPHRFPWRVFHWAVRALLENSAALADHGYSFRAWVHGECLKLGLSEDEFPPEDFHRVVELRTTRYGRPVSKPMPLEDALRSRLEATFYMVGPALAAYMICDWQLWLWREGLTGV